ncbi:uncharacterized protein LOC125762776 isoform X3 [Anopheles funestus]|uniref:uncharacterized protein LOC125762776 isoform X3 n=1 Tax=Anopheles funestus TaxID=62324 RepID=UPI0020C6FC20|nr:uncharacterized protein LOC125762776 isoform X3 [Anopheles funestus]
MNGHKVQHEKKRHELKVHCMDDCDKIHKQTTIKVHCVDDCEIAHNKQQLRFTALKIIGWLKCSLKGTIQMRPKPCVSYIDEFDFLYIADYLCTVL